MDLCFEVYSVPTELDNIVDFIYLIFFFVYEILLKVNRALCVKDLSRPGHGESQAF